MISVHCMHWVTYYVRIFKHVYEAIMVITQPCNHQNNTLLCDVYMTIPRVFIPFLFRSLYLVVNTIVLCRKLLLRRYSINYVHLLCVLLIVIKWNVFTNWLARKVLWTRYFWKYVWSMKIYKFGNKLIFLCLKTRRCRYYTLYNHLFTV